jgi:hypothetical protein
MPLNAIIACIDNALRVWMNPKLYPVEFTDLARELRFAIRHKVNDRHQSMIDTVYSWLCSSIADPSNIIVTKAVRNAVKRLCVETFFNRYVATLGCCSDEPTDPVAPCIAPPAAPSGLGAPPGLANAAHAPGLPAAPAAPSALRSARTVAEKSLRLIDPDNTILMYPEFNELPTNYYAINNTVRYYNEKVAMLPTELKISAVFEKLAYLMDKVDYLAYDAECRIGILSFLDSAVKLCALDVHLYNQVELLRKYYNMNLANVSYNKYYRAMHI